MNSPLSSRPRAALWATPLLLLTALGCGGDKKEDASSGGGGGAQAGGGGQAGQGGTVGGGGGAAGGGAGGQAGGPAAGAAGQVGGAAGQAGGGGAAGQAGAPACNGSALCVQSLSPAKGFVNGGVYVTVKGTGFTSGARVFIGDGRAPARVVDASTLVALVPPGPAGSHDVRVVQGASSASVKEGYTYASATVSGTWSKVSMNEGRGSFPSVTLLQDGRVLIAGGNRGMGVRSNTGELYDPKQPDHTLLVGNSMSTGRHTSAAITLLDGRVLIAGTCHIKPCATGEVDLFDPKTNLFSPAGQLLDPTRAPVRLTLLPDGRVLITSGVNASGVDTLVTQTHNPTAELFDPATSTITAAPFTSKNAGFGRPVRLRDGRILFAGVKPDVAEVLDPDTDTLTQLTGNFEHSPDFFGPMMPVLPDGRVARIAGADFTPDPTTPGLYTYAPLTSIELFDPATNSFAAASGALSQKRLHSAWAVMRDGSVFELGGFVKPYSSQSTCDAANDFQFTYSVEQVAPGAASAATFADLPSDSSADTMGNAALVATTLTDGSILAAGGSRCGDQPGFKYLYFLQVPPVIN